MTKIIAKIKAMIKRRPATIRDNLWKSILTRLNE